MDTEQTFVRVHTRLSGMLAQLMTPKLRILLEHLSLLVAIVLLGLIAVMHVNFVAQPGCAKELISKELVEAQLLQIKITGYGLRLPQALSQKHDGHVESTESLKTEPQINEEISEVGDMETTVLDKEKSPMRNSDLARNIWTELGSRPLATGPIKLCERFMTYGTAFFGRLKWIFSSTWQISRIAGKELLTVRSKSSPKGLYGALVSWLEQRSEAFTPLYIFSVEKGYLMLPEGAKSRHFIHTANISISAQNVCFGNRWQQLVINIFVGYDTILMNSLLNARGEGFLFNFQTKELYDLNYLNESSGSPNTFEGYIVAKSGVLIMSLFVFFTTTTSVSFTLRETQARMLKFTVQLQYHARHGLPTFRLIFIHIIESLVFVPIMIGILFFLFEFYDDQLLAFMVLTLVWLCELFTMISVRTPMSMQYYPRFFLLYFMLFHIYFFSYEYGFSYLAFSTTAAFMQHLILYFWNHFEIPLLRQFLRARALFQQQPGLHITSAVITSTVHVARFRPGSGGDGSPEASGNLYNLNMANGDLQSAGIHGDMRFNATNEPSNREPTNNQGIPNMQFEPPPPFPPLLPNLLTSFSSLLLWILGGPENPLSNSSNLRNPWEQQFNQGDNNPVVWNATQNFPQGMWYTAAGALERLRRRNSGRNPPPEGQNTT